VKDEITKKIDEDKDIESHQNNINICTLAWLPPHYVKEKLLLEKVQRDIS